jgi:hypothetical protein
MDRLIKYTYMILYLKASIIEDLAYAFLRVVVANHNALEEMILDRDKFFISKFWKVFIILLRIKRKLSTSFYTQTDGQTERINQTIETYIRCYMNYKQDNWVGLLLLAQFAYNISIAENTKISPVYTIYKYNPEAYRSVATSEINNQAISLQISDLKVFHKKLAADLVFFTKRIVSYYDKYCNIEPIFKKGDKIYLV